MGVGFVVEVGGVQEFDYVEMDRLQDVVDQGQCQYEEVQQCVDYDVQDDVQEFDLL